MSDFVAKKVYLCGILLHDFIQKKSGAEAHRNLVEIYSDHAMLETTCWDWVKCLKIMILMLKIKNALAHWKSLKTKNSWHSCQAQAKLSESLGVN